MMLAADTLRLYTVTVHNTKHRQQPKLLLFLPVKKGDALLPADAILHLL
jgi:hypothetical protein